MRKHSGSHRAAMMATEYQERFLPPSSYKTVFMTSKQKGPYHSLRGTSKDITTSRPAYVVLRSARVAHKSARVADKSARVADESARVADESARVADKSTRVADESTRVADESAHVEEKSTHVTDKHPPKTPQPPVQPPEVHQSCSRAPHNPICIAANQMASKMKPISEYKNSFQAWKANRRKPYKLVDSLKVNQGLVVTNGTSKDRSSVQDAANSKEEQEPQPFESITSYRSNYVAHPVQPRVRRKKPVYQSKGLPLEATASLKPKLAWDVNQELLDKDSKLYQQFKTWCLENKSNSQGKAKEPSPPAERDNFLSTMHADYTAHKCQRTKPVLPSMETTGKSEEPFQGTTTMKDDYKAWDTPRRFPSGRESHDLLKKSTFSPCIPKSAEGCKTTLKPLSPPHPKLNETEVCNYNFNDTKKTPAENGALSSLESISPGTGKPKMGWTSSLDRGVTL